MARLDFIQQLHKATPRNYLLRVTEADKAACAEIAKRFDKDYFDGDRTCGYGGYKYDGRWQPFARKLIERYGLKPGDRVLDIGCGKGFLVYDLTQALPGLHVIGIDISSYAIEHCIPEIKPDVHVANATSLPFPVQSFDLVLAINSLHNLRLPELELAFRELNRVGRRDAYVVLDSYRTEREKVNLLYWQLTCECFFTPEEWSWLFAKFGYTGDYEFIYFQ
jgi:protein-L-isoaspartate(D-aspartate) O-methyltransferase